MEKNMEQKTPQKKKVLIPILIASLLVLAVLVGIVVATLGGKDEVEFSITLDQREVALEVGEQAQLKVVTGAGEPLAQGTEITWLSSAPEVATVDATGLVEAVAAGEAKITAIVKHDGKEYSAFAVVTVKGDGEQYSTYKLRWYTQKKDRSGYDLKEETFERVVGSKVELTEAEALAKVPEYYTLNLEKCVLTGTVQERQGACVLEVYFDVAEVSYKVSAYYESAKKLGTYDIVETIELKAYAFSEVVAPGTGKEGFLLNSNASDSVLKCESVTEGVELKAFYDRIRSNVKFAYISDKKDATYTAVYGVGLLNADGTVWTDSLEMFAAAGYLNGEKMALNADSFKNLTADAEVTFQVDGDSWIYDAEKGALVANTDKTNVSTYVYLTGSDKTIYLSATYVTTGNLDNLFGVTLRCGDTTREIRFQAGGIGVTKDHTTESGILDQERAYYYNFAGVDGTTVVFAQNNFGTLGSTKYSEIENMTTNTLGGSYELVWAVWEGVLYGSLDGVTVVPLPLNLLNKDWTADKEYEIGITSFDGKETGDKLTVKDIDVSFGKDAEAKLITDQTIEWTDKHRVDYDVLSGAYIPASINGASYIYGDKAAGSTGISANINWLNPANSTGRTGVTVKVGEKTHQFVIEPSSQRVYHDTNGTWGGPAITEQIHRYADVLDAKGNCNVTAVVRDGNFYVVINGKQALCVDMQALFPGYTKEAKAQVGLHTYNACVGLAHFENVKTLSAKEVDALELTEWAFWSEGMRIDDYSFEDGTAVKNTTNNTNYKYVVLYGSAADWDLEGSMVRTDESYNKNLIMGFEIKGGGKTLMLGGMTNGFVKVVNGDWGEIGGTKATAHALSADQYAVNDKTLAFFGRADGSVPRTVDETEFKVVVHDDVFYAWFDGELCWRVPLTEEQFGAFAEGTSYELVLWIAEDSGDKTIPQTGNFENVSAKIGYEVTEQSDLLSDLEKIDANISKWDSFRAKRLTGYLADVVDESWRYEYTADPYAYLKPAADSVYLSATYNLYKEKEASWGIAITQGDETRELLFVNQGLQILSNNACVDACDRAGDGHFDCGPVCDNRCDNVPAISDPTKINAMAWIDETHNALYGYKGYLWAQNIYGGSGTTVNIPIYNMLATEDGRNDYDVVWAIHEDVLYGMLDGEPFLQIPMNMLIADWDPDAEYKIGFGNRNNNDAAKYKLTDVTVLYGEEAAAKLAADKKIDFVDVKDFSYEGFFGSYTPNSGNGVKYAFGPATNGSQAVSTVIKLVKKDNTASDNGIIVRSGSETAQIYISGSGKNLNLMLGTTSTTSGAINGMLPAAVETYLEDGTCEITAVVKDGRLHILLNDVHVGSIALEKILPGCASGDLVQLGLYANNSSIGLARFADTQFVTGEAADDITVSDDNQWEDNIRFLASQIYHAGVDYTNGTVTNEAGKESEITFTGVSDAWNITGTMTRTDNLTTSNLSMGVTITSDDKSLMVAGMTNGFVKVVNGNWGTVGGTSATIHAWGGNSYAFNEKTVGFFGKADGSVARSTDEIYFKAVIHDDVLYVWFGYKEDLSDLELCWRVPLTEEQFGSFAADSVYEVGLRFVANGQTTGAFENINIQTGGEVTGQTELVEDLATIDANVSKWDSFKAKRLTGYLADTVDESWLKEWAATPYAYLKGKDSSVYLSATYHTYRDTQESFGITIMQGDQSRQVYFLHEGVQLCSNYTDVGTGIPGLADGKVNTYAFSYEAAPGYGYKNYLWAQNIAGGAGTVKNIPVHTMTRVTDNRTAYDVVWAIHEGVLYGMLDGEPFLQMPLTNLCAEWTANKNYQIGFVSINTGAAKMKYTDVTVLFGADAAAKLAADKKVSFADVDGFSFEAFYGSYVPNSGNGIKYAYGAATNGSQAISTTVKLVKKDNTASDNGIIIRSDNETAQIYISGSGKNLKLNANTVSVDLTSILPAATATYNADGNCKITAVVKDGRLHILLNDVHAGSIALNKILPAYQSGDFVQLGLYANNPSNGLARFMDVSMVTGDAANAITVSDANKWEDSIRFFTSLNYKGNINYIDGTIANTVNGGTDVRFLGESDIWEVSGKLNRTDALTNYQELPMAVNLVSGNRMLRITPYFNGFRLEEWVDGTYVTKTDDVKNSYRHGENTVSFNTLPGEFFRAVDFSPRTISEIHFKYIVQNDVLYVLFGKTADSLVPCWEIPLDEVIMEWNNNTKTWTDNELFSGFASGTQYNLGFYIYSPVQGQISDLTVKQGTLVNTTQTEETIAKFPKIHTTSDSTTINVNVNKPAATVTNTVNAVSKVQFLGNSETWSVSGKMTRPDTINDKKELLLGVIIGSGDTTLRATTYYQGFRLNTVVGSNYGTDYNEYRHGENPYAFNTTLGEFFKAAPFARTVNEIYFKFIVQNDTLYALFGLTEGNLIPSWEIPLAETIHGWDNTNKTWTNDVVFNGFTAGSNYSLGFFISGAEQGTISDLVVEQDTGVDSQQMSADIAKFPKLNVSSMYAITVDRVNGTISNWVNRGSWAWFKGTNTKWSVEGAMSRTDALKSNLFYHGFAIRSGSNTIKIYGQKNGFTKIVNGSWDTVGGTSCTYHAWGNDANYTPNLKTKDYFDTPRAKDTIYFKAVIVNDIFYAGFAYQQDMSDFALCWKVPLTEAQFGAFAAGSNYELGLDFNYDSNQVKASFTDLVIKSGDDVDTSWIPTP